MTTRSHEDWARRLAPLRLDAEPLEEQLARRRAACRALSAITGTVAIGFFAIFSAFERPLVGLGVAALFWLPIVAVSWNDHRRLAGRAREYEDTRRADPAARSESSTQD